MFRSIGLSLLIMCVFALLQGTTLFAGITNGDFEQDLSVGWTFTDNVIVFDGVASLIQTAIYTEGGVLDEGLETTKMYQVFTNDIGANFLRFDVKFEYIPTETNYFSATLIYPDNPTGSYFYRKGTDGSTATDFGASISDSLELSGFKTVKVPISMSLVDATLLFEWTGNYEVLYDENNDPTSAIALIDNVEILKVVPEPATMTLGLIGVAAVGAVRRRMR
jgi:hypothetical protein